MSDKQVSGWAIGATAFAALMMFMLGGFHVVTGLIAIVNDEFFVVTQKYLFKVDATAWGWVHLILGIVIAVAAAYLFTGAVWARTIGVVLAVASGLLAFAWLPYSPFMALLMIGVAILVVWALTAHGRDIAGG